MEKSKVTPSEEAKALELILKAMLKRGFKSDRMARILIALGYRKITS